MSILRRHAASAALGAVLPLSLAAAWQIAASSGLIDPTQWASPVLVAQALGQQFSDPQFIANLTASLQRTGLGILLGVTGGLVAGLALGLVASLRAFCAPLLDGGKAIPIFTWVPLLSVWVGSGEAGKVTFIALAASLPVLFSTAEGVSAISVSYTELARLLRLPFLLVLYRVILPGAAPGILRGVHLALLYGWLATIGAEYFFEAGNGMGGDITAARQLFRLDLVVADMLVIGVIGIALDLIAQQAEAFLLRWQEGQTP
jgi:sulfonate transport system permease protein